MGQLAAKQKYENAVRALIKSLGHFRKLFGHEDLSEIIGAKMYGLPEALARFTIANNHNEGAWMPLLEEATECAQGQLVLANVDGFAEMALDLIRRGATSRRKALENNCVDGLSYAFGNLPRYVDEDEADRAIEEKYPELGKEAPGIPDFDFQQVAEGDPNCPPGKKYIQRFELDLVLANQGNAYHYKLIPTTLDPTGENPTPTWEYRARILGRDEFDAGDLADFRIQPGGPGYCGDTSYTITPRIEKGFWYNSEFRRAFDMAFYAAQAHEEIMAETGASEPTELP